MKRSEMVCPGEPGFECHDDGAVLAAGLCRNCYHRRWGREEQERTGTYNARKQASRTKEAVEAYRPKASANTQRALARRFPDPAERRAYSREASRRSRGLATI